MNTKAAQVIQSCKDCWSVNIDCSGFVKNVCKKLGVTMSSGNADAIVNYLHDANNGWERLKGDELTRVEVVAKSRADAGQLVMCGLTSGELGDAHGHIAIIISAELCYSNLNKNYYPVAYWGRLGGGGGANKCLSYSFNNHSINKVYYMAKKI